MHAHTHTHTDALIHLSVSLNQGLTRQAALKFPYLQMQRVFSLLKKWAKAQGKKKSVSQFSGVVSVAKTIEKKKLHALGYLVTGFSFLFHVCNSSVTRHKTAR